MILDRRIPFVITCATACTYNRPVTLTPPASIQTYFADNHPTDVLVTDTAGYSHWVHNPKLDGDTLRGVRRSDFPRPRVVIPVADIESLATPHFSVGRTLGLTGAVLAVVGVAVLFLLSARAQPVF